MATSIPPPVASESVDPAVLSTNVYVTRPVKQDDEDQESALDTPYQIHTGRPDLDATFEELKQEATEKSLTRVAVIACGPTDMLDQVRAACRAYSDSDLTCAGGVKFDLHEEMFEL